MSVLTSPGFSAPSLRVQIKKCSVINSMNCLFNFNEQLHFENSISNSYIVVENMSANVFRFFSSKAGRLSIGSSEMVSGKNFSRTFLTA